jgi:hypothetical protein
MDLAPPALGPIQCRKQQRGFPGTDGFTHFLEAGNRETRPACQANYFATTLCQQSLNAIRKCVRDI